MGILRDLIFIEDIVWFKCIIVGLCSIEVLYLNIVFRFLGENNILFVIGERKKFFLGGFRCWFGSFCWNGINCIFGGCFRGRDKLFCWFEEIFLGSFVGWVRIYW